MNSHCQQMKAVCETTAFSLCLQYCSQLAKQTCPAVGKFGNRLKSNIFTCYFDTFLQKNILGHNKKSCFVVRRNWVDVTQFLHPSTAHAQQQRVFAKKLDTRRTIYYFCVIFFLQNSKSLKKFLMWIVLPQMDNPTDMTSQSDKWSRS